MKKSLLLGIGSILLFTGCCKKLEWVDCKGNCNSSNKKSQKPYIQTVKFGNQVCYIENGCKKSCILKLEATGVGVAPCDGACSDAQAMAMARRAAVLDAYKALAEKMYGVKINGRDTVKNMILQNSNLRAYVDGVIRGAQIVEENYKDGVYRVVMSVNLDPTRWNQYLLYASN